MTYVWRGIDWREVADVQTDQSGCTVRVIFKDESKAPAILTAYPGEGTKQRARYEFERANGEG